MQAAHVAVQTGSEDGVHDAVAVQEVRSNPLRGFEDLNLDGQALQDSEVHSGRALEFPRISEDEHPGIAAVRMDLSRHHETVAAVVAGAAEDHESPVPDADLPSQDGGGRLAGIFHQDLLGNPQLFDGMALHRPHLFHCADFHDPPSHFPLAGPEIIAACRTCWFQPMRQTPA